MKMKAQHSKTYGVPGKPSYEQSIEPKVPVFEKSGCSWLANLLMCLGTLKKQVKSKSSQWKGITEDRAEVNKMEIKPPNNT